MISTLDSRLYSAACENKFQSSALAHVFACCGTYFGMLRKYKKRRMKLRAVK